MLKKLFALLLCFSLCLLVGCSKKTDKLSVEEGDVTSVVSSEPEEYVNLLTGLKGTSKEVVENRPVAIMINNISVAQPVQTGLNSADIVYETEVEGGITRLLAVFQNIKEVKKLGTVRSSRYPYIDLAMGHNALYVYHGIDEKYARPHIGDTDAMELDTNNGGARISNGLAKEHTLYGYGDKIWESLTSSKRTIKNSNTAPWQSFADEGTEVKLDYTANAVSVPFSKAYTSTFKFDEATGRYVRYFNGTERKDADTKESITVKNVFVLYTTISSYSDGYHQQVALDSGEGCYFVNGTYTKINWSKGAASNSFKFTNADGTPLTVNAGDSWVCIADKNHSQALFE